MKYICASTEKIGEGDEAAALPLFDAVKFCLKKNRLADFLTTYIAFERSILIMSFPLKDTELVVWLNKFAIVFKKHGTGLGFAPAEVESVSNDAAMLSYLIRTEIPAYESALSARIAYKNVIKVGPTGEPCGDFPSPQPLLTPPVVVEPGVVPRLREIVDRIRATPEFTDHLAKAFGLGSYEAGAGSEAAFTKPTGRAIGQQDSEVRVEFEKCVFEGVLIESRRTGQEDWSRLAIDKFSPYVDSRPLVRGGRPEVREYRMRFLKHDEPIGEWSDILVATASA